MEARNKNNLYFVSKLTTSLSMKYGLDIFQECAMLQYKYGEIKSVKCMTWKSWKNWFEITDEMDEPFDIIVFIDENKDKNERERIIKDVQGIFDRQAHNKYGCKVCVYRENELVHIFNLAREAGDEKTYRRMAWAHDNKFTIYNGYERTCFPADMDFEKYMNEFMKA